MKLKDKIKSYSFWVSLASAIVLILKVLGSRFGFTIDESMLSDLFTALCSILVLLGIIVIPTNTQQPYPDIKNSNKNKSTENIITNNNDNCNINNTDNIQSTNNNILDNRENINSNLDIIISEIDSTNQQEQKINENKLDDFTQTNQIIINQEDYNQAEQTNIKEIATVNKLDETNSNNIVNTSLNENNSAEIIDGNLNQNNLSENIDNINNEDLKSEINEFHFTDISEQTNNLNNSISKISDYLKNESIFFTSNPDLYIQALQKEIERIRNNL